jgi:hypothetical protein
VTGFRGSGIVVRTFCRVLLVLDGIMTPMHYDSCHPPQKRRRPVSPPAVGVALTDRVQQVPTPTLLTYPLLAAPVTMPVMGQGPVVVCLTLCCTRLFLASASLLRPLQV